MVIPAGERYQQTLYLMRKKDGKLEKEALLPTLRQLGIVFGIHFTQLRDERTCRIVLECRPFAATLDRIQQHLQEVVRDIPARPSTTKVTPEEPRLASAPPQ